MGSKGNIYRKINNDDLMDLKKVHKGDQYYDFKINNIGNEGDGIGKLQNGMAVIIKAKNLRIGQLVDIEITNVKNKFAFAKII